MERETRRTEASDASRRATRCVLSGLTPRTDRGVGTREGWKDNTRRVVGVPGHRHTLVHVHTGERAAHEWLARGRERGG